MDIDKKSARSLVESNAQSLFIAGHITDKDLKDPTKLFEKIRVFTKGSFDIRVDHTKSLLLTAEKYTREKNMNI